MERDDASGRMLKTMLSLRLHMRLTEFAKSLATGQGNWDYGVAIERLMDFYERFFKNAEYEARLDELEAEVFNEKIDKGLKQEFDGEPRLLGRNYDPVVEEEKGEK